MHDNFVHIDSRENKASGEIYFWDNRKKKGSFDLVTWIVLLFLSVWLTPKIRKIMNLRRYFKKRR